MSPQRIQRRRTPGWRKPDGAVYVGRPSKWGNRFERGQWRYLTGKRQGEDATPADLVRMFETALLHNPAAVALVRAELAGRDLMCWCPLVDEHGQRVPCHADVLLRVANEETT